MSNHIHFLVQATNEGLSDVLRNFKKFTSQTMIRSIEDNQQESRKSWMFWLLKETDAAGKVSYQFWKPDIHPEVCYQLPFMWQQLVYFHNNPFRAGMVIKAEYYACCSAADYVFGKQVGKVKGALFNSLQTTYS
ncbi:MAG: transposase [Segetibacter sp.]|nr:transposase [Segetibacter sp.]